MKTKQIHLSQLNKGLLSIFLVALLMYFGKLFLIPIAIATLFSMLLYPTALKLQRLNVKEAQAALLSILMLLIIIASISTVLYFQLKRLTQDFPQLEKRLDAKTNQLKWLVYETTDITRTEQEEIIEEKKPDIAKAIFKNVRDVLKEILLVLLFLFIVLTYTFFFLIYHQRIKNFLVRLKLFESQRQSIVMFARISRIIYEYLKGTVTVISIMAVTYTLGLWVLGVEHALLFAIVTALLRIIPYFGSYLGIALTVTFTVLTKDTYWEPALVLVFFIITQLVEANFLTPYITGSKVKLNPLATIMAILLGNLLWGVPGMVLFIPLFASMKVVFDRIPRLNPYGYILGKDTSPTASLETKPKHSR